MLREEVARHGRRGMWGEFCVTGNGERGHDLQGQRSDLFHSHGRWALITRSIHFGQIISVFLDLAFFSASADPHQVKGIAGGERTKAREMGAAIQRQLLWTMVLKNENYIQGLRKPVTRYSMSQSFGASHVQSLGLFRKSGSLPILRCSSPCGETTSAWRGVSSWSL